MKFKVGDQVILTAGKDKGKKGKVLKVLSDVNKVVVEDVNMYVKHIKPIQGNAGEKVKRPRALPTANVAILNNEGRADRIGYKIAKDGTKSRIFKKTGKVIADSNSKGTK